MSKQSSVDTKEAVRLALVYAIEDRLLFLECKPGEEVEEQTLELINAWKKVLKRRYPPPPENTGGVMISVIDIWNGKGVTQKDGRVYIEGTEP